MSRDADADEDDAEFELVESSVAQDDVSSGPRGSEGFGARVEGPLLPRAEIFTVESKAARALASRLQEAALRVDGSEAPELVVTLYLEVGLGVVVLKRANRRVGRRERVVRSEQVDAVHATLGIVLAERRVRLAVVGDGERDDVALGQTRLGLVRERHLARQVGKRHGDGPRGGTRAPRERRQAAGRPWFKKCETPGGAGRGRSGIRARDAGGAIAPETREEMPRNASSGSTRNQPPRSAQCDPSLDPPA